MEYLIFGIAMTSVLTGGACEVMEVFAEAGSGTVLPCKVGSLHPATVLWTKAQETVWRKTQSGLQFWGVRWKHKETQRVRCPHDQFERGDYSLQINNVKPEDAGLFSCMVRRANRVITHQVMLRIIQVSISPSVPMWEGNFSISCRVTPPAEGAAVQWTLNNSSSIDGVETAQASTTGSVFRGIASASLVGDWACVVRYQGQVGRAAATLAVKGILQPSKDNARVYAALGSAATLPCVFSPGLVPSSLSWERLKPGFPLKPATAELPASFSPPSPSSHPSVDKSAILREVHLADEGTYRCSGTVEGQRFTRNLQLVVAKVDIGVPSKEAGSLTMTCRLTDTSEVTRYEWVRQGFDQSANQSAVSIHEGRELTLDNAPGDHRGEWTCRFYGKQGVLGNATHHVPVMSGLSGQKSGLSHKTSVVVGLSFLLVALLLVLVQAYRNHRRRKRILQYPTLETIVHRVSYEREEKERSREKKAQLH